MHLSKPPGTLRGRPKRLRLLVALDATRNAIALREASQRNIPTVSLVAHNADMSRVGAPPPKTKTSPTPSPPPSQLSSQAAPWHLRRPVGALPWPSPSCQRGRLPFKHGSRRCCSTHARMRLRPVASCRSPTLCWAVASQPTGPPHTSCPPMQVTYPVLGNDFHTAFVHFFLDWITKVVNVRPLRERADMGL